MDDDLTQYGDVGDLLARSDLEPGDPDYLAPEQLVFHLTQLAEAGWEDAALELGYQLSAMGPDRDPEAAYRWFHIGYSWSGYSTDWDDTGEAAQSYSGPVGDFRSEAPVCDLMDEIPHGRLKELDSEAKHWLSLHQRHP